MNTPKNKNNPEFLVKQYAPSHKEEWNNFIAAAKNATFLFNRNFMDYHSDRFEDFSLMVYKDEKLYAVLPANKKADTVISHQGLTYGSFVLQEKAKLLYAFEAFKATLEFLYTEGIKTLDIRVIPTFYNTMPADELEYFLFKCDATLLKRDASMVIDYAHTINFIKSRRQCIKRAAKNGLTIKKENKFDVFWNKLLIPNMSRRYDVAPVHSLEEIELLASSFPENIQQFNVYKGEDLVAGTTVFLTKTTIHPQYIAANTDKNALESIDFLYNYLINDCNDTKRYFDFSTSSEENGTILNKGILFWKESYGARTYTTDNYLVETKSYKTLDLSLI